MSTPAQRPTSRQHDTTTVRPAFAGARAWCRPWALLRVLLPLYLSCECYAQTPPPPPLPATLPATTQAAGPVKVLLDDYPSDRIFPAGDLVLPTRLINQTDKPLQCTVRTVLAEYRPNEEGQTVAQQQQDLMLAPGVTVAAAATFRPVNAGPYEFRLTISTTAGSETTTKGALLYNPRQWSLPNLEPNDFDAFWQATLAEMRSHPLDPQFAATPGEKPAPAPFREVSFSGLGDRRIRGYLGIPPQLKPGQKVPAILSLPSASYHSAAVDTKALQQGYVFLAISIHDMPFGGDSYRTHPKQHWFAEPYQGIGRQSKETFYYRAAYVAGARAVDYLRSLPEVDPQKIIVIGLSQGGSLTLATAALQPDIALAEASVPGRSRMDLLTTTYKANMSLAAPAGMTPWQMFEKTLAYYDVSYFARRVRCPILLRMSLDDPVNPGALQYWAFMQLTQSPDARATLTPGLKHQAPADTPGHVVTMRAKYAPSPATAQP